MNLGTRLYSWHILIQAGADVNIVDYKNSTPLILAAWYGHVKSVELLIQKGACVNSENSFGQTALLLAVSSGYEECTKTLI